LSRLMYLTRLGWLLAIIILGGIAFLIGWLLKGPIVLERTELESFAPVDIIYKAGATILIILASVLLVDIYRMFKFSVGSLRGIPLIKAFIEFIKIVPLHFFAQLRLNKCTFKRYWYIHLMIFYGFGLLMTGPLKSIFPNIYIGFGLLITGTVLIVAGIVLMIIGRLKRKEHVWKYSHHTDWVFITLLFMTVITGILTGVFRALNNPLPAYTTYALHLIFVVLLFLEVPFAKWSHMIYRPFSIYFYRLNQLRGGG